MKAIVIVAAGFLGLSAIAAQAQEGPSPEQQRESDCNTQANKQKVMKFSDRKSFVDACMRGDKAKMKKAAAPAPKKAVAKNDRSKVCSKQAADRHLKGDDRKKYMSQCNKA